MPSSVQEAPWSNSVPRPSQISAVLKLTREQQFISSRGNEYFCEIDEDYLTDRFNLTGLNTEVQYYQYALDLVTDVFDMEVDDDMREQIEKSARHLYGLVHARYIVTTRGLAKMVRYVILSSKLTCLFLLPAFPLTLLIRWRNSSKESLASARV